MIGNYETQIQTALTKYEALLRSQLERVEKINGRRGRLFKA